MTPTVLEISLFIQEEPPVPACDNQVALISYPMEPFDFWARNPNLFRHILYQLRP